MKYFVSGLLRLLNFVPDRLAIRLSLVIARLLVFLNADIARISRINIDRCFPELTTIERQRLMIDSLQHAALLVFEFAYLQYRPLNELLEKISGVEGEELLQAAWDRSEGVLLLMPHFGCWEFLSVYLGRRYSISALYDPPNVAALEESMTNMRQRQGAVMHSTTPSGLRGLMRGLKAGDLVVVLPDQVPGSQAGGIAAPFFHSDALTMLLGKRLMKVCAPQVLLASAWRKLGSHGIEYKLSFEKPAAEIYSSDDRAHAVAMNRSIEIIVRRDPAQYQWSYKRFRRVPASEGGPPVDPYRRQ